MEIYFKDLTHVIVGAGESQACRPEIRVRVHTGAGSVQGRAAGRKLGQAFCHVPQS